MENQFNQTDEKEVRLLYRKLLQTWNDNNATAFANLFTSDGNSIGFDGSQMNGQRQIDDQLDQIFASHKVSSYVGIIREVRSLCSTVFVLRAVAGMVPPGQSRINPAVNVIQTLIAQKEEGKFRIAVFHNTPAAFHGRPDLSEQLTEELQKAFNDQQNTR